MHTVSIVACSASQRLAHVGETMNHVRPKAAIVTALTIGASVSLANAQDRATAMTCTNPVSGANWQLKIDYGRNTVDSNPARIGDATITWHDAKDGGNYTLDRKSGNLTVIVASSTGGAFFYHRCKQVN